MAGFEGKGRNLRSTARGLRIAGRLRIVRGLKDRREVGRLKDYREVKGLHGNQVYTEGNTGKSYGLDSGTG